MGALAIRSHFQPIVSPITLAALVFATSEIASASIRYRTVALTGNAAPDMPEGATFSQFDTPVISGMGRTAFFASVSGGGVQQGNDSAFYSESSGSLGLVVREGDSATDAGGGISFGQLERNSVNITESGLLGFRAELLGTGVTSSNDDSLWVQVANEGLSLHAREGDVLNGSIVIDEFVGKFASLNDRSVAAFRLQRSGPNITTTNDDAFYRADELSLFSIAVEAELAPGAGTTFRGLGNTINSGIVINSQNKVVFDSELAPFPDRAVWSEREGGLQHRARFGDTAPGALIGSTLTAFGDPDINRLGNIVFDATITGNGINDEGVFRESAEGIGDVAVEGDSAPGFGVGVGFGGVPDVFVSPVINAQNEVAFVGHITGGDFNGDPGVWVSQGDSLKNLAQEGDSAPGFVDFTFSQFGDPTINALGQVVFQASVTDGMGANAQGLWAWNGSQLELVVAQGSPIEVESEGTLIVDSFLFAGEDGLTGQPAVLEHPGSTGNEDGRPSALSDNGEIVFFADFNSVNGILVATISPLLPGDYNANGLVDTADYSVWLSNLGAPPGSLPNDDDGGEIGLPQFDTWKANIGMAIPVAALQVDLPIPEPGCLLLILLILVAGAVTVQRTR